MGQLRDKVGTGVIAGEKLNELFEYAKENQFALPAVNVTSSSSINAVLETAVKVNAPVIVQFSNGGGVFMAGKTLSNENQQKNMLIDMVTGKLDDTPVEEAPIGDAYLPTLGAVTVAGTAATAPSTIDAVRGKALGAKKSGITKTALKTLGRGLTTAATPLGLLATEPLYLAEQIQEGDSLGEMATNPFNYVGPAFAGQASDFATKGLKSPGLSKAMRLGISPTTLKTVSRRFGLPGLALSLGISGYEMYDDYKRKRGMFSEE